MSNQILGAMVGRLTSARPNIQESSSTITPRRGPLTQPADDALLSTGPIQVNTSKGVVSIFFGYYPKAEITVASVLFFDDAGVLVEDELAEVRRYSADAPSRYVGRREALRKALEQSSASYAERLAIWSKFTELEADNIQPPEVRIDGTQYFQETLTPRDVSDFLHFVADDLDANPLRPGEGFTLHIDGVETDTYSVVGENFSEAVQ